MAYEKADFYAAYGIYAVDPETRHRYANFRSPKILNGERITCKLHYHPLVIKPGKKHMAQRLVDYLSDQGTPLSSTDKLCVIGGAFGWLGEALEDLIPGLEAVSVDLSDYVQEKKSVSPDDELIESIESQGHTKDDGGVGQFLFEKFSDPAPRCRKPDRVVKEDLGSPQSRGRIRQILRQNDPTRLITEEVWQLLTQEEKDRYAAAAAHWGVPMTHIIDSVII